MSINITDAKKGEFEVVKSVTKTETLPYTVAGLLNENALYENSIKEKTEEIAKYQALIDANNLLIEQFNTAVEIGRAHV